MGTNNGTRGSRRPSRYHTLYRAADDRPTPRASPRPRRTLHTPLPVLFPTPAAQMCPYRTNASMRWAVIIHRDRDINAILICAFALHPTPNGAWTGMTPRAATTPMGDALVDQTCTGVRRTARGATL